MTRDVLAICIVGAAFALLGCTPPQVRCGAGDPNAESACEPECDGAAGECAREADAGVSPEEADAGPVVAPELVDDGLCRPDDIEIWAQSHARTDAKNEIAECLVAPTCDDGPCEVVECLQEGADITSCKDCISRELECLFANCSEQCGAGDTTAECLYCACQNGCTAEFEACAGQSIRACELCFDGEQRCQPGGLSPALIMTVLG